MHWIFGQLLEAVPSMLCLIPGCLLLHYFCVHSRKRTFGLFVFGIYIICVLTVVGFPNILYHPFEINLNLIPIVDMKNSRVNTVLNVILFIPLGIMLPLLWIKYRKFGNTLAFSFLASLLIELSQLFTYRATDVDDLITNTLGGCIGYGLASLLLLFRKNNAQSKYTFRDLPAICGICLVIMFFLHPFLSQTFYHLIY